VENTLYLHFSNEKWVSDHEFSVFLFEFVSRDDTKNIMRAEFTCKIHILCRILVFNSRSHSCFLCLRVTISRRVSLSFAVFVSLSSDNSSRLLALLAISACSRVLLSLESMRQQSNESRTASQTKNKNITTRSTIITVLTPFFYEKWWLNGGEISLTLSLSSWWC